MHVGSFSVMLRSYILYAMLKLYFIYALDTFDILYHLLYVINIRYVYSLMNLTFLEVSAYDLLHSCG